jgi:hypothetical protein
MGKSYVIENKKYLLSRDDCVEHAIIANVLINDVVVDKKELFILSLDLRGGFGNVFMNWSKIICLTYVSRTML